MELSVVKTLDTSPEKNKQAMTQLLLETLDKVKSGETTGMQIITENKTGYEYSRIGIPFEKALGLYVRAIHDLNKQWDETK